MRGLTEFVCQGSGLCQAAIVTGTLLSRGHGREEFFSPGVGWSAFKERGRDPLRAPHSRHVEAVSPSQFTCVVPMHVYSEEDKGVFENYWASLTLDKELTRQPRSRGYHECPREQAMDTDWRPRCAGAFGGVPTHTPGVVSFTGSSPHNPRCSPRWPVHSLWRRAWRSISWVSESLGSPELCSFLMKKK